MPTKPRLAEDIRTILTARLTVPGGEYNVASGNTVLPPGQQAQAVHAGAFVWADAQNSVFSSAGINTFNIRASGGVYLDPSTPAINFGGAWG